MYLAIANYKQLELKVKFFLKKRMLCCFLSDPWLRNGFTRMPLHSVIFLKHFVGSCWESGRCKLRVFCFFSFFAFCFSWTFQML